MIPKLLPHCVDGLGERTPGEARLSHDVVFLGDAKRRLTQQVLDASHIYRVPDRPEARGGMPEAVQVQRKSESLLGAPTHGAIHGGLGSSFIGRPEGSVRISTGDSASEPFQIQIDARA